VPLASERPRAALPSDEQIESVLAQNAGNVRGTARALGMHRNQLRRWLEKRAARNGTTVPDESGALDDEG
jgi:ActR/RegA family two-component response regulator